MTLTRRPRYRMIALVVLGLMLGTATFSFAAGGTIASPGPTGEYLELDSFQALDVVYHLDPQNPRVLEQVQFNTKGQSTAVAAGLEFQGRDVVWVDCLPGEEYDYACDLSELSPMVAEVTGFRVTAQ